LKILVIHLSPTYAHNFSIFILRVSISGGVRLLGKVEASREEILELVEQKQGMDYIKLVASEHYADKCCMTDLSLDIDKVNDDGPSLKLSAGFSVSLSTQHDVSHQTDAIEDQSEAFIVLL
jgi:hypothetical protein